MHDCICMMYVIFHIYIYMRVCVCMYVYAYIPYIDGYLEIVDDGQCLIFLTSFTVSRPEEVSGVDR